MLNIDCKQKMLGIIRNTYVKNLNIKLDETLKLYGGIQELLGCINQSEIIYASDVENFNLYLGDCRDEDKGIFYFAITNSTILQNKYNSKENTIVISNETHNGRFNVLFDKFIEIAELEDEVLIVDKQQYNIDKKSYRKLIKIEDSEIINKIITAINKIDKESSILQP